MHLSEIFDGLAGAIGLHRGDAGITRLCRGVHLAGADDLVVGGFEVEMKFAVAGLFLLIALVATAVALN
ncbi:hypothetical protein D3C84_1294600 [compost metagenome]